MAREGTGASGSRDAAGIPARFDRYWAWSPGVAAKLERRRIVERTARGRADAKANGVKFGRKPILTPHQQNEARARVEAGETQRSVARSYNVSQATISRLSA